MNNLQKEKPLVLVTYVCPTASQSPSLSALLGVNLESAQIQEATGENTPSTGKRFVYGLKGIQELFNVSHPTAQRYKDGIIKEAVRQSGRKIIVDVDKALELFSSRNGR